MVRKGFGKTQCCIEFKRISRVGQASTSKGMRVGGGGGGDHMINMKCDNGMTFLEAQEGPRSD